MTIDEMKQDLKKNQTKHRYEHIIGVADTAACLAMRYGESVKQAYLAGLLHDNAKHFSEEALLRFCMSHQIEITKAEQRAPYLLHAKVGAYLANEVYGIQDADVLNAIAYHTTCRAGMSMLEKIIALADYIEPSRKEIPNLSEVRGQAFVNLDQAVILMLQNTIEYVSATKGIDYVDPLSKQAYDNLCNQ